MACVLRTSLMGVVHNYYFHHLTLRTFKFHNLLHFGFSNRCSQYLVLYLINVQILFFSFVILHLCSSRIGVSSPAVSLLLSSFTLSLSITSSSHTDQADPCFNPPISISQATKMTSYSVLSSLIDLFYFGPAKSIKFVFQIVFSFAIDSSVVVLPLLFSSFNTFISFLLKIAKPVLFSL